MLRFTVLLAVHVLLLIPSSTLAAGESEIHLAARAGDLARVSCLLDDDPSLVNARTDSGETPLHYAVEGRQLEVVGRLLDRGADVNATDEQGRAPLHVAALLDGDAVINMLLARGANPEAADVHQETALHLAARRFHPAPIEALIAAGADVNARNLDGETPLHVLGAAGRPDVDDAAFTQLLDTIAAALIAAGAEPGLLDNQGLPAWPHAAPGGGVPRQPPGYPTPDEIAATLLARATSYPTICQRVDLGVSGQGRHIYALKISDNVNVEEDEPEFKFIANMHGDEVVGLVMCLDLIDYLLQNYGTIQRVTDDVNNIEIWIVPTMNPDGYVANTRGNATGADLNRNFPEGTNGDPNTPAGHPIEVGIIMNWSFAHSFTLAGNFHGGSLVANYPFDNDGLGSVFSPTPDEDLFVWIAEQYSSHNLPMWNSTEFTHGITNGAAWYSIDGGMQDWDYRYMGGNEITFEIGNTKSPPYSDMPSYWNDNRDSMLAYLETSLIGVRGIVTNGITGAPLAATVSVVGRDHPIYTDPDVGDYHRMLMPGTYSLTFSTAGFDPVTVSNVVVNSGAATRVDVQFWPPTVLTYPNGGESLPANTPVNVTWTGSPLAQYHLQYSANYGQIGAATESFESGVLDTGLYPTGGNLPWTVVSGTPHTGTYSARAGAITNSQTSWMTRTATGGPFSFYYRVSSQSGSDWFNFYIDGSRVAHRSGTVNWTQYSTTLVSGTHTLKWEYVKDAGGSSGSDTVWIDDVTVSGDITSWSNIIDLTGVGATSTPWTPVTPGDMYKVRVRAYVDGGYGPWDESNSLFTVTESGGCAPTDLDGDIDLDGHTDGRDVQAFCSAILGVPTAGQICHGDFNGNSQLDIGDVAGFVTALLGS